MAVHAMRSSRLYLVCGGLLGLFSLAALPAQAQITTTNLLLNPGAETGSISGWTVGGTSNPGVDNGSFDPGINPNSGSFDFYGNNGPSGTLSQNVTLSGNQGITVALIDSGLLTANVTFFEQGLDQGAPSDDGSVTLTFLDAGNSVLGSVTTPEVDSHNGAWQQSNTAYAIPVGARTLTYTMNFLRNVGSDNDSFIDDNSLIVTGRAVAVPEPGSVALLVGLSMTGAGFLVRRRKQAEKCCVKPRIDRATKYYSF